MYHVYNCTMTGMSELGHRGLIKDPKTLVLRLVRPNAKDGLPAWFQPRLGMDMKAPTPAIAQDSNFNVSLRTRWRRRDREFLVQAYPIAAKMSSTSLTIASTVYFRSISLKQLRFHDRLSRSPREFWYTCM